MKRVFTGLAAIAIGLATFSLQVSAEESFKVYEKTGSFDDVSQDIQDAVVDKGLVIDFTGHVGKMLERTSAAVGAEPVYLNAVYYTFCSAKLSNAATEADPRNVAICPYSVFVYETKEEPGTISAGYRLVKGAPGDASQKALGEINALLDEIVKEATE